MTAGADGWGLSEHVAGVGAMGVGTRGWFMWAGSGARFWMDGNEGKGGTALGLSLNAADTLFSKSYFKNMHHSFDCAGIKLICPLRLQQLAEARRLWH